MGRCGKDEEREAEGKSGEGDEEARGQVRAGIVEVAEPECSGDDGEAGEGEEIAVLREALPPDGAEGADEGEGDAHDEAVEAGVGGVVEELHHEQAALVLIGREDDEAEQPGAQGDAAENEEEEDGDGLCERWSSQKEGQQQREQQIEVFFDAERPDMRERMNCGVVKEGEVPEKEDELPEGGGAGGLAPERNGEIEQKDGEVCGQDAVGATGVEVFERERSALDEGLEQLRADEEAAEDEEEVHAAPTDVGDGAEGGWQQVLHVEVIDHDNQDGRGTQGVEPVETEERGWCGGCHAETVGSEWYRGCTG